MRKYKFLLVFLILLLSLILRFRNFDIYPQRGATSDEYAFAFLGVSLIKEQKPISWSAVPIYEDVRNLTIDKLYFPIVTPYLDHPPLFGLIVGLWSILLKEGEFEKVSLSSIRFIPIILALISSILVYLIGKRLYGFKVGIWALLIFTTSAIFVINSRVVVAESLITVFLLSAIYFLIKFSNNLTAKRIVALGVISGLSFFSKILGIVVFPSIIYFLFEKKVKRKLLLLFILVFSSFALLLIFYGVYFGGDLFLKVQLYQGSRDLGPQTLLTILTTPIIINKIFFDGWYFWGLFSLFLALSNYKKNAFIIVPSLIYLLLLILSLNQKDVHGWYILPLFPFFALASAQVLNQISEKTNWLVFIFLLILGNYQIKVLLEDPFGLSQFTFRLLILILVVPSIVTLFFKNERMFKIIANFWFYAFILGNIIIVLKYIHPA